MGTPAGILPLGAIDGHCAAGAVKRAFGCAARLAALGRPGRAVPVGQLRRRLGRHALPPHVALGGQRRVGEDGVAPQRGHRVGVRRVARAGRDAEEAGLGIDRVEPAVLAEAHPGDVVADRLDLPARHGRHEHGQVGLAAGRGERARDVVHGAGRSRQLEDQHVLGQPALLVRHHRGDAQGEALLAEQGVAAVARAERPDLARLREVRDRLVARCRATARRPRPARAARPGSARRARTRRRRRVAPAPRRPCASSRASRRRRRPSRSAGRRCGRSASRAGPSRTARRRACARASRRRTTRAARRASVRVAPVVGRPGVLAALQMNVRSSTRATSPGSERAQ